MASKASSVAREGVFRVDSPYQPAGDQPKAIAGLVDTYRRTLETQEFEARIVALEGKS